MHADILNLCDQVVLEVWDEDGFQLLPQQILAQYQ